jgi:signal recognition particle receptor subunit alpha
VAPFPAFQVAYQRILQLTYVDELLGALKTVFVKLFQPFLAAFVASLHAVNNTTVVLSNAASQPTSWNFAKVLEGWDVAFDKLLKGLENKAAEVRFCHECTVWGLTPGYPRHFRTANHVCDPLLDHHHPLPALFPVTLIPVGVTYPFSCFFLLWMLAPAESHPGTVDEQQISRNVQALKNRLRGRGGARAAGRGRARGDPGSGRDSHPNSE